MDFDSAFAYIESFTNLERIPGNSMRPYRLDRMKALLDVFGNPQDKFSSIHISGSKGKGSTGLYIACSLADAGLKTGLYTSPHVSSYRERITIAGQPFPDDLLVDRIAYVRTTIDGLPPGTLPGQNNPTTFELLTLLAYLTFVKAGMEWAVIETGIGGRLDATNILKPVATVHTPVELEHTEVLGDTIEKIAAEKAGIIKPGSPAFCSYQKPEAIAVFAEKASAVGVPLFELSKEIPNIEVSRTGGRFHGRLFLKSGEIIEIEPGMPGVFQVENGALAFIVADDLLSGLGHEKEPRRRVIRRAIARAQLPGRMELISEHPPVLIDAAHTPSSAARLVEAYSVMFQPGGVLLFGSVLGKNPLAMAKVLCPSFKNVIISTPGTFKPSDPRAVYRAFLDIHPSVHLILDPVSAYSKALELAGDEKPILVTGSFYMIAEIRSLAGKQPDKKVGRYAV